VPEMAASSKSYITRGFCQKSVEYCTRPGGVVITPVAVAFLTGKRMARGSIPSPNSKFSGFCKTLFCVLNTVIQKYRLTAVHNSRTKYIKSEKFGWLQLRAIYA
jgi:hypothetical protein